MKRLSTRLCLAGSLTLLIAWPSWAQHSGSGGISGTSGSRGSTGASGSTQVPCQSSSPDVIGQQDCSDQPFNPQSQTPLYVDGRVTMDTGQPVPEPVSVGLYCGLHMLQGVHTDMKGYFEFSLGTRSGDTDFSASNDNPFGSAGGLTGSGTGGLAGAGLTGCEVRVTVAGYQTLSHTISDPPDLDKIAIGTMQLSRIAGAQGSAISVTSLLVPNNARKEFEEGEKDFHSNRLKSAAQHFEKATADYDKYAAAWSELGGIYAIDGQTDQADQAFAKAIAADPKYTPPYLNLANLELQNQENLNAILTAEKALELDPTIGFAHFIQAVGRFNLNQVDAAEKSALEALKDQPVGNPQAHALLADIYLRKQDSSNAAAQMKAYLKEAPKGELAVEMKNDLEQIEGQDANLASPSGSVQAKTDPPKAQ